METKKHGHDSHNLAGVDPDGDSDLLYTANIRTDQGDTVCGAHWADVVVFVEGDGVKTNGPSKLTFKQRRFCHAFTGEACGNGTEAARSAGYKGNDVTLAAVAYENLRKPQIARFIDELRRAAEKAAGGKILSAVETLVGLSRIALADIGDLFEDDGTFDLAKAKERGMSRLIKSMSFDKDTGRLTKLEVHNAHGAYVDLGKYHKLFVDKVEIVQPEDLDAALERELARLAGADQEAGASEITGETVH